MLSLPCSAVLVAGLIFFPLVKSCGVLVHNEVVKRASNLFSLPNSNPRFSLLQPIFAPLLTNPNYAPSVQAGAFFPDYGYQCFATDSDSEAAHWPPFLVAAVEHINSKYGSLSNTSISRSPDEQAHLESLIAFIFSLASHQTADTTWHAIHLPTGFLQALAEIDFKGEVRSAHRTLDFGGDFLEATRWGWLSEESREWISSSWTVPIDDLLEIYARIGRSPNRSVMQYCMKRGIAALRSELALGQTLLEPFAASSPMLLDQIDQYYLGGIDEMTARTVNCWANLTHWFAYGVGGQEKIRDGWGVCDVFEVIADNGGGFPVTETRAISHHAMLEEPLLLERTLEEMKNIRTTTNSFGVETYTLLPPNSNTPKILDDDSFTPAPGFENPIFISAYISFAHMGGSLSTGRFVTSGGVAIGSPTETYDSYHPNSGNVVILPFSQLSTSSTSPPSVLAPLSVPKSGESGSKVDERFGTSSTSFRALNRTFLAVSSPGPLSYHSSGEAGKVFLYLPDSGNGVAMTLTFHGRGSILGGIGSRWAGVQLSSADLDGSGSEFLIVSSPFSDIGKWRQGGEVYAIRLLNFVPLTSASSSISVTLDHNLPKSEDIYVETHTLQYPYNAGSYPQFGVSIAASPSTASLFVLCPGQHKAFIYAYTAGNFTPASHIPLIGETRPKELVFLTPELLAVGSPNDDEQKGVVRVYNRRTQDLEYVITASERRRFDKFGGTLAVDANGALLIGSRWWGEERGAIWRWNLPTRRRGMMRQAALGARGWFGGSQEQAMVAEIVARGEEIGAGFGATIAVGEGRVVVGVPRAGRGGSKGRAGADWGGVVVF